MIRKPTCSVLAALGVIAAACASKPSAPTVAPTPAAAAAPVATHQMCWLSTKEITTFDLSEPRKHTKPPIVDKREVSAIGITMTKDNRARLIGVWFEKEDATTQIPVDPENELDVTKQQIQLNSSLTRVLKIDSTKAKRTSERTWIWQGDIFNPGKPKKPKQHVFLFCARES